MQFSIFIKKKRRAKNVSVARIARIVAIRINASNIKRLPLAASLCYNWIGERLLKITVILEVS